MAGPDVDASRGRGGVGEAVPHDSAELHVSGEAVYTDDIIEPRGLLHLAVGLSSCAHGRVRRLDLDAVRGAPGVADVLTADDIPGENNCGPVIHDDPILAPGLVQYAGQAVFQPPFARTSPPFNARLFRVLK